MRRSRSIRCSTYILSRQEETLSEALTELSRDFSKRKTSIIRRKDLSSCEVGADSKTRGHNKQRARESKCRAWLQTTTTKGNGYSLTVLLHSDRLLKGFELLYRIAVLELDLFGFALNVVGATNSSARGQANEEEETNNHLNHL